MALPQYEIVRRMRRSLVLTMALVIVGYALALGVIVYPWDVLVVHGGSLRHLLPALAPLAVLSTVTLLFLGRIYKDNCIIEATEEWASRAVGANGAAFDVGAMLKRAGRAVGGEDRLEAPEGLPFVRGEPLAAEMALAVLMAEAARSPGFAATLSAEEDAVRLDLRGGSEPEGPLLVAERVLQRAGAQVERLGEEGGGWRLTFPAAQ